MGLYAISLLDEVEIVQTRVESDEIEELSLGISDAISSFNMGKVLNPEILRKLNIDPGDYTVEAIECLDKQRLLKAKYSCLEEKKEVEKNEDLKGREGE
ncbi:hypothetical protein TNCV_562881 [Trichonephila clavipes]|nr:hypothetical protein TNCV_562881 [Trichonephila clavipes]